MGKTPYKAPIKAETKPLNPQRIETITKLLSTVRSSNPTFNLAQTLTAVGYFEYEIGVNETRIKDPFHQPDDVLLRRLEDYAYGMNL